MLSILLIIIGSLLILFVLTPSYLYLTSRYEHTKAIIIKVFTTLIPLVYALLGYVKLNLRFSYQNLGDPIPSPYWVLIGLVLFTLANIMLHFRILVGGVLLLLEHLAYIIFFLTLGGFHSVAIVVYTLLCVATLCYFYRYTPVVKRYLLQFELYAMIILVTLALGLLLPFTYGIYGLIPALASLFLVFSDFMIARNKLLLETKFTRRLAFSCYFFGHFLMAMTLYVAGYLMK